MDRINIFKVAYTGLLAGFVGQAILGALFVNPITQSILYNPEIQSQIFIQITSQRDIFVSVLGLIILSVVHAWLYAIVVKAIPGNRWHAKGLFWGFSIWLMYWVFQEWFVYRTLLNEPLILNLFELTILLVGSLAEGLVIAWFFRKELK